MSKLNLKERFEKQIQVSIRIPPVLQAQIIERSITMGNLSFNKTARILLDYALREPPHINGNNVLPKLESQLLSNIKDDRLLTYTVRNHTLLQEFIMTFAEEPQEVITRANVAAEELLDNFENSQ